MKLLLPFLLLLSCFFCSSFSRLQAQDTVIVRAFNFDDYKTNGYKGMIKFPAADVPVEKVLMRYRLRCPYERNCGEWDYLAYVFLNHNTGKKDTVLRKLPDFRVNGQERDSFIYINSKSYRYSFNAATGKVDSVELPALQLVLFQNADRPAEATDTLTVWEPYYRIIFDDKGNKTDSVFVNTGAVLLRKKVYEFYEYPDRIDRYELARYITPYGNWLRSDWKGMDWIYDVSDFRPLLTDSNYIDASSLFYPWTVGWYELLELTFYFVKGTPPRDIRSIRNVWTGNPAYGVNPPINEFFKPQTFTLNDNEKQARLRLCVTGHGFGGTENCSEFCPKTHTVNCNNESVFESEIFRRDCGFNPLYPQAGTWIYDRAGWCPGAEVNPELIELTPALRPGRENRLTYSVENYRWNGQGSLPTYVVETQLVTYGEPNFKNNAAIIDIPAPNNREFFNRINPICNNPQIVIRNNGSESLSSARITYGVKGQDQAVFNWKGNLVFGQTETVMLPPFMWGNWDGKNGTFQALITEPNGKTDEYLPDSRMETRFSLPDRRDSVIVIRVVTNRRSGSNAWRITDANRREVARRRRAQMPDEELFRDTVRLKKGCYRFEFTDSDKDGLEFFVNNAQWGIGQVGIQNAVSSEDTLMVFNPNFGTRIEYQFTVGYDLNADTVPVFTGRAKTQPSHHQGFFLSPNPSSENVNLVLDLPKAVSAEVSIYSLTGQQVLTKNMERVSYQTFPLEVNHLPEGVYFVRLMTSDGRSYSRKMILQR